MSSEIKPKILFVDDDHNVLTGLRRVMRNKRDVWDTEFANSGQSALSLFEQEQFDIVVSDMKMPEMNGAELLSVVCQRFPSTSRLIQIGRAHV